MSVVCAQCARRTALFEMLGARLDFCARDQSRFWDLLTLADRQLIEAIGGRQRQPLRDAHARWGGQLASHEGLRGVCRHRSSYPRALAGSPLAPCALYSESEPQRIQKLLDGPVVAIVGTDMASDHGMETARWLAGELAACGVCVAGALGEGIARAARAGSLEAAGPTVSVLAGGLERLVARGPADVQGEPRVADSDCTISELCRGATPRPWSRLARARTLALMANLVIVVEARENPRELACARLAQSLGKPLAAVPGRLGSASSEGCHRLIREGATLVRDARDALDLLYGADVPVAPGRNQLIEPRLMALIEQVARGHDTLPKLMRAGAPAERVALELAELELRRLLVRGDGGRYVPAPAGAQVGCRPCQRPA